MYDNVEIFALIITSIIIISGDWSWNRLNARHKYFAFVKQISPCKKKKKKKTGHFPFYILILWSLFAAGTAFLRITRWVRGTHTPKKWPNTFISHRRAYCFSFSALRYNPQWPQWPFISLCSITQNENWKSFSAYHDKQKVNTHTHSSAR